MRVSPMAPVRQSWMQLLSIPPLQSATTEPLWVLQAQMRKILQVRREVSSAVMLSSHPPAGTWCFLEALQPTMGANSQDWWTLSRESCNQARPTDHSPPFRNVLPPHLMTIVCVQIDYVVGVWNQNNERRPLQNKIYNKFYVCLYIYWRPSYI